MIAGYRGPRPRRAVVHAWGDDAALGCAVGQRGKVPLFRLHRSEASLCAVDASEAIAVLQMAMIGGLDYTAVRDAVITHPTVSEGLTLLFTPAWLED